MPFQSQALNDLAATVQGAAAAATQANALAANAQQQNAPLAIAGDAVEVNTDYTMDGTKAVIIADTATASGDITITLPDAALNGGKMFWVKRTGGVHTVVILPQGSQTIDGLPTIPGGGVSFGSFLVVAIGDNWSLLSPTSRAANWRVLVTGNLTLASTTVIDDIGSHLDAYSTVTFVAPAANSGDVTVTLPSSSDDPLPGGELLLFRNASAHDLIIAAAGSPSIDTINGVASVTVATGKTITLIPPAGSGSVHDWLVVGNDTAP